VIEAALIVAPSRADALIFGRPLLERLLLLCRRADIPRCVVETGGISEAAARAGLGRFADDPSIKTVESLSADSLQATCQLAPSARCVKFSGNLVLGQSQLRHLLSREDGLAITGMTSTDAERGGLIMVGPLQQLLSKDPPSSTTVRTNGVLPFALNGRAVDREEAEVRLAQAVREESLRTDSLMARIFDRRFSWRISLPLARLKVAPNFVTLSNTLLGFGCAALLATTSYWLRLIGALLFVFSITLDGVDGELARLRMVESEFGGKLDVLTDNLVHIAIFIGVMTGCFRASQSHLYIYLLVLLLIGFGLCAISVNRALSLSGDAAARWISRVERATGRDFAYLVAIFALINRLAWFAWGVTFGAYVFAGVLWRLTTRMLNRSADEPNLRA